MAGISNPTTKLTLTEVPDDVWAAANFAVDQENVDTGSSYVLEDVLWYLPNKGDHYIMAIQVIGEIPTNLFGVIVHKDAETGKMTKEQFNPIFNPLFKEMA